MAGCGLGTPACSRWCADVLVWQERPCWCWHHDVMFLLNQTAIDACRLPIEHPLLSWALN
jgi:hypothetical protein